MGLAPKAQGVLFLAAGHPLTQDHTEQRVCVSRPQHVVVDWGRVTVGEYGDNIQATALPGDHWRRRHNFILQLLHRMCRWAGLPAEMEVFNFFSGLLRQEGLSRLEQHQQR